MNSRFLHPAATFALVFLAGLIAGRVLPPGALPRDVRPSPTPTVTVGDLPAPINAGLIREAWDVLHDKFSGALNDQDLAAGILRGLVAGTDDLHTVYADTEESRQFASEISGSFTGVGIEIAPRDGVITIIAPLRGSPAERAGLRAGDIVIKIDGEEITHKMTLTEVVGKIRGPAGTSVDLTVVREGAEEPLSFSIRRERIRIQSVELTFRDEVAVITLSAFNEDTSRVFRRTAREIIAKRARGIVLDLRNNPGGILDQALALANHFLPPNTLIASEVPKAGLERIEHRTEGPGDLASLPTVLLINGGSASASEILAAAIHEQRDAPLIGTQTFGKGSVQELVELSDGSTIRVTIARWHTPKDRDLSEEGIPPTVEVKDENPTDDPDEVLEKGLELLRQQLEKR